MRLPAFLLSIVLAGMAVCPVQRLAAQAPESRTPPAVPEQASRSDGESAAPTTQPADQENLLRSPAEMIAYFASAVDEDRIEDAVSCMDFSRVDEEVRKARAFEYVSMLVEIFDRLTRTGHIDPNAIPEDPTAQSQTIGKDPLILIVERQADLRWRFSASTVESVPTIYDRMDELVAAMDAATEPAAPESEAAPAVEESDPLRSPYHMMGHFLVQAGGAKRDPAKYESAIACLDFSQVDPAPDEATRVSYVDNLEVILGRLREGGFDREDLSREDDSGIDQVLVGTDPLVVILVRQSDGRWRFSATTVQRIPSMMESLVEQSGEEGSSRRAGEESTTMRLDHSSPQATMNRFLTAMNEGALERAVDCLDLSELSEAERKIGANTLAGKLLMVLNRHHLIVLQEIPNDAQSPTPYTPLKYPAGRIEIDRVSSGERKGDWLFTTATISSLERLYQEFEKLPIAVELRDRRLSFWKLPALYIREYLVPASLKREAFVLQLWQWIGLGGLIVLGIVLRWFCTFVLVLVSRMLLRTEQAEMLPRVAHKALTPTANLVTASAWWLGVMLLDLGIEVVAWASWCFQIITTVIAVAAFYRLIDMVTAYFAAKAARTASRMDDVLVPLMQRTAKVIVIALGVIIVADAFGFKVNALLTGLGLGGLAIGLAAQDSLKNFFGSVNVVLDRPFQVGDWVRVGSAEGTVESVGLRSSRIRTFYNSEVVLPNSELMNATVDNMGRRKYRRVSCKLSVTYSTPPEKLEAFCEAVRELIRQHPYTRKDYYHVYVNEFGDSAINILLYLFWETPDWATELRERHRLFVDIVRVARRLGVDFAFPTQTVHLHHESNPPEAPPTSPSVPDELDRALMLGKEHAASVVRETLGDDPEKPPPVKF